MMRSVATFHGDQTDLLRRSSAEEVRRRDPSGAMGSKIPADEAAQPS